MVQLPSGNGRRGSFSKTRLILSVYFRWLMHEFSPRSGSATIPQPSESTPAGAITLHALLQMMTFAGIADDGSARFNL
jgi:hypothetical protein